MKSTIYQHHLRASASFSYRHLLHWKRGDPARGAVHLRSNPADPAGRAAHPGLL